MPAERSSSANFSAAASPAESRSKAMMTRWVPWCFRACQWSWEKPVHAISADDVAKARTPKGHGVDQRFKKLGMAQQALSAATEIHVQQIKRYEAGSSLPTADALKKLAIALHVTSDFLLFETDERGPNDRLRYQFEAISRMPMEEQELVRGLLDAVIVKHQVAGAIARAAGPATKGKE